MISAATSDSFAPLWSRSGLLFSGADHEKLRNACVAIAGVGGVGCMIVELLARLGVGQLRLADPDTFDESNLNRQLFALRSTLGRRKVDVGAERVHDINPECKVTVWPEGVTRASVEAFVDSATVVVPQLDTIGTERLVHQVCYHSRIPVVKGSRARYPGNRWEVRAFVWDYRQDPRPLPPDCETPPSETISPVYSESEATERARRGMLEKLETEVDAGRYHIFRPIPYPPDYVKPEGESLLRQTICAPIPNAAGVLATVEALKVILDWEAHGKLLNLLY